MKTSQRALLDAVAATCEAINPCSPASLATSLGLLSAAPAYSPMPDTNRSAEGRSRTKSLYASAPASSPPPIAESRSTSLNPRSTDA